MTAEIVRRLLAAPVRSLEQRSGDTQQTRLARLASELFGLSAG